ncbi:large ribosomal subunit protein uL23-like [Eubalaena glacialis]|uniref:large ribosomal subunit protein uL23-like n=1 Tax=Eubalaena glacialis TaxID=27606 RepID=UPI002A5AF63C|nr:large ribosomal subunit protein uL23-like [Eubalaena glacialis]
MLKGVQSHQKKKSRRSRCHPPSNCLKHCSSGDSSNILRRAPWEKQLEHYAIIKIPLTIKSAMKKAEDKNTPVFIVDITTTKHQIKQAVKKLYDTDVAKVNTMIRPDGEKKAYV